MNIFGQAFLGQVPLAGAPGLGQSTEEDPCDGLRRVLDVFLDMAARAKQNIESDQKEVQKYYRAGDYEMMDAWVKNALAAAKWLDEVNKMIAKQRRKIEECERAKAMITPPQPIPVQPPQSPQPPRPTNYTTKVRQGDTFQPLPPPVKRSEGQGSWYPDDEIINETTKTPVWDFKPNPPPPPPPPPTITPSRPFSPRNIPRGTQSPFSEEQGMVPSEDWRTVGCRPGTQRVVPGGACVPPGLVSTALTMPTASTVPTQMTTPMSPGAFSLAGQAFLGQVPLRRGGFRM